MPSFGVSIAVLSLAQGVVVTLPRSIDLPFARRLRGGAWSLIPVVSLVAVAGGLRAASGAAQGLTYLALVAVPLLAAIALGATIRGARRELALLVVPLFALAWADRRGLAGEAAALALTGLSCAALGSLLAEVTPASLLKLGIVAMATVDAALVVSDLLRVPNDVLNAAHPAAGLPQLQREQFGRAVMGYGDLFVAGVLGGVLARQRRAQLQAALIAAVLGLAFDLLFLVVSELPATVPIALTLIALELRARGRQHVRRGAARPVAARAP